MKQQLLTKLLQAFIYYQDDKQATKQLCTKAAILLKGGDTARSVEKELINMKHPSDLMEVTK